VNTQPKVFDRTDRVVCKRCHMVLRDFEPAGSRGEFYHPKGESPSGRPIRCKNAGITFVGGASEVVPFVRKSDRRRIRRNSAFR